MKWSLRPCLLMFIDNLGDEYLAARGEFLDDFTRELTGIFLKQLSTWAGIGDNGYRVVILGPGGDESDSTDISGEGENGH